MNSTYDRTTSIIYKKEYTLLYKSNAFVSNGRLKLAKNQAILSNTLRLKFFYLKILYSSPTLSSKSNRAHPKKKAKEQVCLYSCDYTINHNENDDENEKIDHIDTT